MISSPLKSLNCRLDPWQTEYGLGFSATDDLAGQICTEEQCSLEVPSREWIPLDSSISTETSGEILFVDGVRRIHLRLIQQKDSQFYFGAIGSIAVGATAIQRGRINTFNQSLLSASIKHLLLLADCSGIEENVRIPLNFPDAAYFELQCHPINGRDPEDPLNQLQQLMRNEEARLIQEVSVSPHTSAMLLIADGPLNMQLLSEVPAVGYVKSLHTLYIPEDLHPTIWKLEFTQRSPIFLIQPPDWDEGKVSRYSCYVRIARSMEKYSVMSGLVRLEMSTSISIEEAKKTFDRCAREIPFFASAWGMDPRAPQNLVPLAALEMELRRRIGHPGLLQRILQDQF